MLSPAPAPVDHLRAEFARRAANFGAVRLFARFAQLFSLWLGLALGLVVADQLAPGGLSRAARLVAGLLWGATLLFGLLLLLRAHRARRVCPRFVAQRMERAAAIRHNVLLNGLLVSDDGDARHAQPVCAAAALHALDHAPAERADRGILAGLAALGLALAVWGLYAAASPTPIGATLVRLVGSDALAPTATTIRLVRPALGERLYLGEPLELEFELEGRSYGALAVEVTAAHGPVLPLRFEAQRQAGAPPDRRTIRLAPSEFTADLRYRARCGDATLEGFLPARALPRVVKLSVTAHPPAYAQSAPNVFVDGPVEALRGAELVVRVEGNAEIHDAIFVLRGDSEARTRMAEDPEDAHRAVVRVTPTSSGEFWVEFSDVSGRRSASATRYPLRLLDDAPPTIAMSEVAAQVLDVAITPWLQFEVTDDVQLARVTLFERRPGAPPRSRELLSPGPTPRTVQLSIPTAQFEIGLHELREVWLEAADHFAREDGMPAPHVVSGPVVTLTRTTEPPASAESAPASQPQKVEAAEGTKSRPVRGGVRSAAAEGRGAAAGAVGEGGEEEQLIGATPSGGARTSLSPGEQAGSAVAGNNEGGALSAQAAPAADSEQLDREMQELAQEFAKELAELRAREGSPGAAAAAGDAAPGDGAPGAGGAGGASSAPYERAAPLSAANPVAPTPPDDDGDPNSIVPGAVMAPVGPASASSQHADEPVEQTPDDTEPPAPDGPAAAPEQGAQAAASQPSDPAQPAAPRDAEAQEPVESAPEIDPSAPGIEIPPEAVAPDPHIIEERPTPSDAVSRSLSSGRNEWLGLIARLERQGALTDQALAALGWSPVRIEQFQRRVERILAATGSSAVAPIQDEWQSGAQVGVDSPSAASPSLSGVSSGNSDRHIRAELELITPPPEQGSHPLLQELLDAYYQSIAERRGASSRPAGAPG